MTFVFFAISAHATGRTGYTLVIFDDSVFANFTVRFGTITNTPHRAIFTLCLNGWIEVFQYITRVPAFVLVMLVARVAVRAINTLVVLDVLIRHAWSCYHPVA